MDPHALGLVLTISEQGNTIADLRQRLGALEGENAALRAELAEKTEPSEAPTEKNPEPAPPADTKGDNK